MLSDDEDTQRILIPETSATDLYSEAEARLMSAIANAYTAGKNLDTIRPVLRSWLARIAEDRDDLAEIRVKRATERAELQQTIHRTIRQDNAVLEAQVADLQQRLNESQARRREIAARLAWLGVEG